MQPSREPAYISKYNRALFAKRRAILRAHLGGRCAVCGSVDDLQFDHIDPSTKRFKVASGLGRSMKALLEEAAKCQLLCVACHREKTSRERAAKARANMKHGKLSTYYRHKCRCAACKKARSDYYFEVQKGS